MSARKSGQGFSFPSQVQSKFRQDQRETLHDLDSNIYGREREEDIVVSVRDGHTRQRCHGGYRIIRKNTPE